MLLCGTSFIHSLCFCIDREGEGEGEGKGREIGRVFYVTGAEDVKIIKQAPLRVKP